MSGSRLHSESKLSILILIIVIVAIALSYGCSSEAAENGSGDPEQQAPLSAETPTAAPKEGPSCPRGLTYDPAPGACVLYTDKNNNGNCDLAE